MYFAEYTRSDNILLRGSHNICAINLFNKWGWLAGFTLNYRWHLRFGNQTRVPNRSRHMVYNFHGAMLRKATNLASTLLACQDNIEGKRTIPFGRKLHNDASSVYCIFRVYLKIVREFKSINATDHVTYGSHKKKSIRK